MQRSASDPSRSSPSLPRRREPEVYSGKKQQSSEDGSIFSQREMDFMLALLVPSNQPAATEGKTSFLFVVFSRGENWEVFTWGEILAEWIQW